MLPVWSYCVWECVSRWGGLKIYQKKKYRDDTLLITNHQNIRTNQATTVSASTGRALFLDLASDLALDLASC